MDFVYMCTVVNFSYYNFDFYAAIACESSSGFVYKLIKEYNYEKEYNFNNNVGCVSMCWNNYLFSA